MLQITTLTNCQAKLSPHFNNKEMINMQIAAMHGTAIFFIIDIGDILTNQYIMIKLTKTNSNLTNDRDI